MTQTTTRGTLFWKFDDPCAMLEEVDMGRIRASSFLHGFCDIFALALHDAFGYDIEVVVEEEPGGPWQSRLVHVYCRDNVGNYIDVRGVTNDKDAFRDEFADFLSDSGNDTFALSENELRDFSREAVSKEEFDWLYGIARSFIDAYDYDYGYQI